MDRILEVLAKYNVTPLQLVCAITYSLECHLDDIRDGEYPTLYPSNGEKLLEELNVLSYHV